MTTTSRVSRIPAHAALAALLCLFGLGACDAPETTQAAAAAPKPAEAPAPSADAPDGAKAEPAKEEPPAPSGPTLPKDACELFAEAFVDLGKYTKAEYTLVPTTVEGGVMLPGTAAGVGCEVKRKDNDWAVLSAYYLPTEGDAARKSVESKIASFPQVKLMGLGEAAALMGQPNAEDLYASGDVHIIHDDHALVISWRPSDEAPMNRALLLGLGKDVTAAADAATK